MTNTYEKISQENDPFRKGVDLSMLSEADRLKVEPAVLLAILEVESGGSSFDRDGRLKLLPEKHIFHRQLKKRSASKLRAAARAGLTAAKWKRSNYKGLGKNSGDARWRRLEAMVKVDEEAALLSCSWGAAQIMGFNFKAAGFLSVETMCEELSLSEMNNARAFISILESFGLTNALRTRDWKRIARRYNGPGQVKYYAGRMEKAYRRLLNEGEAKPKPKSVKAAHTESGALSLGSEGYRVKALQKRLGELGYATAADGDFGSMTQRAVLSFQAEHGLIADGVVGKKTQSALDKAEVSEAVTARSETSADDLMKAGSKTVLHAGQIKTATTVAGAGGAALSVLGSEKTVEALGQLTGKAEMVSGLFERAQYAVQPFLSLMSDYPLFWIVPAAAGLWWLAHKIQARRLDDHRRARHVG